MANTIFTHQDRPELLACQLTQRHLYSSSKRWQFYLLIVGLCGIVMTIIKPHMESHGEYISILCGCVLALFGLYINWMSKKRRIKAASVQQYIDATLFSSALGENERWGRGISDSELAKLIAEFGRGDAIKENLTGWYSDYGRLTPEEAVFMCQKENVWWDKSLRLAYVTVCLLAGVLIILVISCLSIGATLEDIVIAISQGSPLLIYIGEAIIRFMLDWHDALLLNDIADDIESSMQKISRVDLIERLIQFQCKIWRHRERCYLIPDWFYNRMRPKHQNTADRTASMLG